MTNAEMSFFEGSQNFVKDIKPLYVNLYNINIDCVGAKEAGPLALKNISKITNSSKLYDSIKNTFKKDNVEFSDITSSEKVEAMIKVNNGVSDYISFEKAGIPNIHIAQSNITTLLSNTTANPDILDFNNIKKLADSLSEFIRGANF